MSEAVVAGETGLHTLQAGSGFLQGSECAALQDSGESKDGVRTVNVPGSEISGLFTRAGHIYPAKFGYFTPLSGAIARLQGSPSCDWGFSTLQGARIGQSTGGVGA